jgi:hypothetical protein
VWSPKFKTQNCKKIKEGGERGRIGCGGSKQYLGCADWLFLGLSFMLNMDYFFQLHPKDQAWSSPLWFCNELLPEPISEEVLRRNRGAWGVMSSKQLMSLQKPHSRKNLLFPGSGGRIFKEKVWILKAGDGEMCRKHVGCEWGTGEMAWGGSVWPGCHLKGFLNWWLSKYDLHCR